MRDMLEIGLNFENCELWLERAVFAIVAVMFVVIVVRVSDLTYLQLIFQLISFLSCISSWRCTTTTRNSPDTTTTIFTFTHPTTLTRTHILIPSDAFF